MQKTLVQPGAPPREPQAVSRLARSGLGWAFLTVLGVGAVIILARSLVAKPTLFVEQVINGLQLGFMYALIALGYTMVYGIVRLINFAHGDVFMVGAFVSYYAITRYSVNKLPERIFGQMPPALSSLLGTLLVIALSMAVCALMVAIIERVAYKPLRNAPRIAALITAMAFRSSWSISVRCRSSFRRTMSLTYGRWQRAAMRSRACASPTSPSS
jgi:branched-subunit amino acid ABC-type transport system permease component